MKTGATVSERIARTMRDELEPLGFVKRMTIYTKAISPGVHGWLGLNSGRWESGVTDVNPVIGVRHDAVEKITSSLFNLPHRRWVPPSISWPLAYQMPGGAFAPFLIHATQVEVDTKPIILAIRDAGFRFLDAYDDLESLATALPGWKYGLPEMAADRLPVVLGLLGRTAEALDALEAAAVVHAKRGLPIYEPAPLRDRFLDLVGSRERPSQERSDYKT